MKYITLIVILLIPFSLMAQSRLDNTEIYIGTSHGVTASIVGFKPKVEQDFLLGYNGGLVFRYIADKNVGVQTEINFAQQGWCEQDSDFSRRLSYVEVPFMTHIYMGKKATRFTINLGPQVGLLINEQTTNAPINSEAVQQITPSQNTFDYGFVFGLGLSFKVRKNVFQFETRAYYALGDVYSNAKRDYFSRSNNMKLSANLAWLLQVK